MSGYLLFLVQARLLRIDQLVKQQVQLECQIIPLLLEHLDRRCSRISSYLLPVELLLNIIVHLSKRF